MKKIVSVISLVLALVALSACEDTRKPGAQAEGQKQTETAFAQQSKAVPYPADQLRTSLERTNLKEKLLRENKSDKIGYVYIYNFGQVVGYYVIKGKVSSNQSQMTTTDLINYACDDGLSGCQANTVVAPGDDGSYGDNEPGIFFFTTEGNMVKTSLDYIYAEQPLTIDTPRLGGNAKTGP